MSHARKRNASTTQANPETAVLASLVTPPWSAQVCTLSLHDALPISCRLRRVASVCACRKPFCSESLTGRILLLRTQPRSEEHTSELQSPMYLVCRPLLEKKKSNHKITTTTNASTPANHISRRQGCSG